MSRWTDRRILLAAFVGIVLVGIITVVAVPPPPAPVLSVRSVAPDGAMALSLWLEQSGYRVRQVLSNPIKFGETEVLFILNPLVLYTNDEAQRIRNWVFDGHTLIVAGSYPFIMNEVLNAFDVSMRYVPTRTNELELSAPTLIFPPVPVIHAPATYIIDSARKDIVTHTFYGTDSVLVSFAEGRGTVWVVGMQQPFTNQGLQEDGSAELILNMLALVPPGSVIGFDEARHGFQEASVSLSGWLVGSAAGWGILVGIALTMWYLVLRGRRFGRAVPIPEEQLRREPVEYIQAIANLFRRSGQRDEMLTHYRLQLRRRLSERYAVDPRLGDNDFVRSIAGRDSTVDEAELKKVLSQLNRKKISEAELLETVIQADNWMRKIS
jgi:hypothetical protein